MTDDSPSICEQAYRFTSSNRGRIPIALVGVLVLVGAVVVAGHVGTQDDPNPDVDASLAVDRTESVTQTAVRDGTKSATRKAAEQPLSSTADNEWGAVLAGSDDPFREYLKALIYLEVSKNLDTAGQEVDDVTTTVSLPAVDGPADLEDAMDRVHLETNPDGQQGVLQVEITNITTTANHQAEQIEHVEDSVNVSLVTPIMELHDRVETYEEQLNAGIAEPGFTQRFNARIYGLGYLRGWAQNYRAPVVEVIANRHVEPSVNSAIYRTQQDVFGAADPALQGAVQAGWACMLMQDGEAFIGESEYSFNKSSAYLGAAGVNAQTLCRVTDYLLDPEQDLELNPESLVSGISGMDQSETVEVGKKASLPIVYMAAPEQDSSFDSILERMYTFDSRLDTDVEVREPLDTDLGCVDGTEREQSGDLTVEDVEETNLDPREHDGTLYEYTATLQVDVELSCVRNENTKTEPLELTVTSTVEAVETAPEASIDEQDQTRIEHKWESGPEFSVDPLTPGGFPNYDAEVQERLATNHLEAATGETDTEPAVGPNVSSGGLNTSGLDLNRSRGSASSSGRTCQHVPGPTGSYECWIRTALQDVTTASDVEGTLEDRREVPVSPWRYLDSGFLARMVDDISRMQREAQDINVTFSRKELLESDPSPFDRLLQEIESVQQRMTTVHAYENVGEKTLYEARYTYFELLKAKLEWLARAHGEAIGTLESELDGAVDSLDEAMAFLKQGTNDPQPGDTAFDSPNQTDEITYQVSGSPTYLEPGTITKSDVPAVSRDTTFAPLAMKNTNYIDLPYEEVIDGILGRIGEWIGVLDSSSSADISFRMAGDVLVASELALEADESDDHLEEPDSFEENVTAFEASVEDGVDQFEQRVANETTLQLYNRETAWCLVRSPEGWTQHLLEAGKLLWEVTEAQMDRLSSFDEPPEEFDWEAHLVEAADATWEAIKGLGDQLKRQLDLPLEDEDDAKKRVIEDLENPDFDHQDENYEYRRCMDQLEDIEDEDIEKIEDAREQIRTATADALEEYNGTAMTATNIGRGNVTADIIANLKDRLGSEYMPEGWDTRYDQQEWETILESAARPAISRASSLRVDIGSPAQAEAIDEEIQTALENVTGEIVDERLGLNASVDALEGYASDELRKRSNWVGNSKGRKMRAARVPAGLPLLPVPGYWYATVNVWNVEAAGEYARFEATANMGRPDETTATTYVRENQTVAYEIGGETRQLGSVEPISFDGRSVLVVVVPTGVGVGDRGDQNPECSPTYPVTGNLSGGNNGCGLP